MERVVVKMGEVKVSKNHCSMVCYGLGSCVGLFLYDPITKVSGSAHIMLPYHTGQLVGKADNHYAKEALENLIAEIVKSGGVSLFLQAKLVGGANLFISGTRGVGWRILEVLVQLLLEKNIPVMAKDIGGNEYRTARFFADNGRVEVKTLGRNLVL